MTVKIAKNAKCLMLLRYAATECTMKLKLTMTLTTCIMIILEKDIGVTFKY